MKRALYSEYPDTSGSACVGVAIINYLAAYAGLRKLDKNGLFWRYAQSPFTEERGNTIFENLSLQVEYVTQGVLSARMLLLDDTFRDTALPVGTSSVISSSVLQEYVDRPFTPKKRSFIALKFSGEKTLHAFVYHRPSPVLGYGYLSNSDGWLYTLEPNENVGIIAALDTVFVDSIDKLCLPD